MSNASSYHALDMWIVAVSIAFVGALLAASFIIGRQSHDHLFPALLLAFCSLVRPLAVGLAGGRRRR